MVPKSGLPLSFELHAGSSSVLRSYERARPVGRQAVQREGASLGLYFYFASVKVTSTFFLVLRLGPVGWVTMVLFQCRWL